MRMVLGAALIALGVATLLVPSFFHRAEAQAICITPIGSCRMVMALPQGSVCRCSGAPQTPGQVVSMETSAGRR